MPRGAATGARTLWQHLRGVNIPITFRAGLLPCRRINYNDADAIAPFGMTRQRNPTAPTLSQARVKSLSLADQAYEAVKSRILTLFFLPGQYLNESGICDLLELGRTPVHQALQRLQLEGLVEIIPRKGVIIQPGSISQILEILDARALLETELARKAAGRATREDIAILDQLLANFGRDHGGGAIDGFLEHDRAFHVKIAEMSGNAVLADFLRSLHERTTRSWYLHYWQTLDPAATSRQHRAIVTGIRERNGDKAAKAMRLHISSLQDRLQHIQAAARQP